MLNNTQVYLYLTMFILTYPGFTLFTIFYFIVKSKRLERLLQESYSGFNDYDINPEDIPDPVERDMEVPPNIKTLYEIIFTCVVFLPFFLTSREIIGATFYIIIIELIMDMYKRDWKMFSGNISLGYSLIFAFHSISNDESIFLVSFIVFIFNGIKYLRYLEGINTP